MRAHTITTKARLGARAHTKRGIVPRGILGLSLAVALLAATASTASTTPTPAAPPLTLDVLAKKWEVYESCCYLPLKKKLKLRAITSNDSTLVAGGDLKRTTKQLATGEKTTIKAKLEQSKWKQLKKEVDAPKPIKLKAKIEFKATDEFGQTATDELELNLGYPKGLGPR